jgi:transposase
MRSSTRPPARSVPAPTRPRRDREALEVRRRRAAELFAEGVSQAETARRLKVSRESVSRWYEQWRQGGVDALRRAERAGRPPRLTVAQLQEIETRLLTGARANGYPTELWTLRRVAEVIERETGTVYHPGHVWRILRRLDGAVSSRPGERSSAMRLRSRPGRRSGGQP